LVRVPHRDASGPQCRSCGLTLRGLTPVPARLPGPPAERSSEAPRHS
jgi:hypothetical protein